MPSPYTPPGVIVKQEQRTRTAPRLIPQLSVVVIGEGRNIVVREVGGEFEAGADLTFALPGAIDGQIVDDSSIQVLLDAVDATTGRSLGLYELEAGVDYTLSGSPTTEITILNTLGLTYSILSARNNSIDTAASADAAQGTPDGTLFSDPDIDFLSRGATTDGSTVIRVASPAALAGDYAITRLIPSGSDVNDVRVQKLTSLGAVELSKAATIDGAVIPVATTTLYGIPTGHVDIGVHGYVTQLTAPTLGLGVGVDGAAVASLNTAQATALIPVATVIPDDTSGDAEVFDPISTGALTPGDVPTWTALLAAARVGDWLRFTVTTGPVLRDYKIVAIDTALETVTLQHPNVLGDRTGSGTTTVLGSALTSIQLLRVVRGRADIGLANAAGDYFTAVIGGVNIDIEILNATPTYLVLASAIPAYAPSNVAFTVVRGFPYRNTEATYDVLRSVTANFGGNVLVTYEAARPDLALNGLMDVADTADIEEKIGLVDPANPLALGCDMVTRAGFADGTRVFYALGLNEDGDTLAGHQAALDALVTEDVYYVVPLTQDKAVISLYQSHVEVQSQPQNKHERVLIASTALVTVQSIVPASDGDPLGNGTVSSLNVKRIEGISPTILANISPGQVIKLRASNSATASVVAERRVQAVNSTLGYIDVLTDFPAPTLGNTYYFTVETFPFTKGEQAEEWRDYAKSLGSKRVMLVRPDEIQVTYTDKRGSVPTDKDVRVPMSYGCCAFAGLCASLPPQQPMTNVQVPGINRLFNSNFYFTPDQLNTIAEGGNNILVQNNRTSAPYSNHQLTTNMDSLEEREFSIVKLVDFSAKFLRSSLRPYIGNHNITAEYLTQLRGIVESVLNALVSAGVLLNRTALQALYQDPDQLDNVIVEVTLDVPYPCNTITVTLFI